MNDKESEDQKLSVFYNSAEISRRVATIASEIAQQLKESNITSDSFKIISLLKGGFVFTADLIRELYKNGIHPQIDFLAVSSYGNEKKSSGNITLNSPIMEDVQGKHVLIVDDILESGNTLHFVKDLLEKRGASSVKVAVFLEKPGKLKKEVKADFVGFMAPDKFIVGYGLDYANNYRELPFIAVLEG